MKMALKRTAIAASTVAFATLLSLNWSERYGFSLAVETAQANGRGYADRSYVTGRPMLTPRYYYCRYGVGCAYGSLGDYYRSFVIPGFPASFYGEYGGYSDGYYGRYQR